MNINITINIPTISLLYVDNVFTYRKPTIPRLTDYRRDFNHLFVTIPFTKERLH